MTNEWYRVRIAFCFIGLLLFFLCILLRIVQLQILPSPQLEKLSKQQFRQVVKKVSSRQPLFDRNYEELAVSIPAGSIYARPRLMKQKVRIARALATHLEGTQDKWLRKLKQKKSFVWIQRQVSSEKAKEISALKLPGIFVESESKRLYPNGTLAAHILGFTDVDGKGISGAELKANASLTDDENSALIYKDGKGNAAYIEKESADKEIPIPGVALTIDRRIQSALEEELSISLRETGAKSVMAVVMDPHNGEIFAMGQAPTFDPNNSKKSSPGLFTNHMVNSLFEPGSTVKPLLVATALQDGRFKRHSYIDCGNGSMSFGKDTIGEAESNHRFGKITMEKVIHYSSNIGAARIGLALGTDRVRGLFERFGLLNKTGIQLPGETTGSLRAETEWVPILLATSSFGQGIAVTPLQMVVSYAPFANGGFLVRPTLFKNELEHKDFKRILSPKVAKLMTEILTGVTEENDGTGVKARIQGLSVAGKTGTGQKYVPGKGYDGKKYFSSFIGFLPADHPQLLIGVMIDEPQSSYYGSQVAAPVFRKIAERSLQLLDKNPRQILGKALPNSETTTPSEASIETVQDSPLIENMAGWTMPELKGLSMKEVFTRLDQINSDKQFHVKYIGTGFLQKQEPEAGSLMSTNRDVSLYFAPEKAP